jgi:hypothetical protein
MFQPKPYTNSIAVPLYIVNWNWSGSATKTRGGFDQDRHPQTTLLSRKISLRGRTPEDRLTAPLSACSKRTASMKIKPNRFMRPKHIALTSLVSTAAVGLILAQGLNPPGGNSPRRYRSPYDPRSRPPVALAEAYPLAAAYFGTATNRFYCVSASCLEIGLSGFPAWKFSWSDTNGERAYVEVTFNKEVYPDPKTENLLRNK